MELKSIIETRASVRQYKDEPIAIEDIKEIVRLAGLAPSVNNSQPWKFIAITNKEKLKMMSDAVWAKIDFMLPDLEDEAAKKAKSQVEYFSTFFSGAPVVIAILSKPYEAIVDKTLITTTMTHEMLNALRGHPDIQSVGASVENLLLAACDMGYGGCWLSGPMVAREDLEKIIDCKDPWRLSAMVSIGIPANPTTQKEKKALNEIFELID